jgi:hypothetical protein
MPLELFSNKTIFIDHEGIEAASLFIDKLDINVVRGVLSSYINDVF